MKNPIKFAVIVIVVAVLGIGAFTLSQNSSQSDTIMPREDAAMKPTDTLMKNDELTMKNTDDTMIGDKMMSSQYVEYLKTALDNASTSRRVLFFYASWCPTCRQADLNFKENESKIPEDVTIIRVNYNDSETDQEEKDLAKKYGVTYQHTFVQIDGEGKEITKWNGGQINELQTNIK